MKKFIVLILLLDINQPAFTQSDSSQATIKLKGHGYQTFINKAQDSISITGLENLIDIEFPNSTDSIYYQLIGYDKAILLSSFAKIRYTNLSGGEYKLKYRFASQKEFSFIEVNIEKAFWQKWWLFPMIAFYLLLLFGIGIYFFFLYNFRQKMKLQLLRNKISADLHDEVGSNLSSIAIYTQVLKKGLKDTALFPIIDKITANSKESVTLMQDTVWAINPLNDSTEKLFKRIEDYARSVLSEKNISFDQHAAIPLNRLKLNMDDRKNLYLILKEGINNIAKHSEATKATLEVIEQNKKILFTLKDNGIGFEMNQNTDGNGLRNFKERAENSNYKFQLDSKLNKGTEIVVEINH